MSLTGKIAENCIDIVNLFAMKGNRSIATRDVAIFVIFKQWDDGFLFRSC